MGRRPSVLFADTHTHTHTRTHTHTYTHIHAYIHAHAHPPTYIHARIDRGRFTLQTLLMHTCAPPGTHANEHIHTMGLTATCAYIHGDAPRRAFKDGSKDESIRDDSAEFPMK
eukprot:GHVU01049293.1.p2 GENE.GHVU01049293.1~~GHVU01049293.1.p2  ORF type:complete len:113 (+),score=8.70 GHVU01049293.1:554-892(+)